MFQQTVTGSILKTLSIVALATTMACGALGGGGGGGEAMKYIPAGSEGAMVINMKKVTKSPLLEIDFIKKQIEDMKKEENYKKLLAAGVDPFTNVDNIIVAGKASDNEPVVIVSGSFDAKKAAEAANKEMMKGEDDVAEAVTDKVIILGKKPAVEAAKQGKGLDGSPELKALLAKADSSKAIYGAGVANAEMAKQAPLPQLQKIKSGAGSLGLSDGVDIKLIATMADEAAATDAKKEAETNITQVKPMAGAFGIPVELIDALSIETSGAEVTVTWKASTDQIKSLIATAEKMLGAMGGGMGGPPVATPPVPEEAPKE